MPYMDRLNRVCGFLDIEVKENSGRFQRRYFILDTQGNALLWYMDNPQNLPSGATTVGSLQLTYISKVSEATLKQKPKTEFCFVINAASRRYFLQADDAADMRDWVATLNKATKITVPKAAPVLPRSDAPAVPTSEPQAGRKQQAYKAEIIGGVVVHTPIHQNDGDELEIRERRVNQGVWGVGCRPGVLRCGYCVKQGNVRKSWKRRFFTLDDNAVSYFKCETDKEPLRAVALRDIQKVHECLVKSGELLLRDNLFEIITSSRVFYIQTDSQEDMHGWIRDIGIKIQDFRGPAKGSSNRHGNHGPSSAARPEGEIQDRRPPLVKSCSVAPGWQPWTPVPQREASVLGSQEEDSPFTSLPNIPSLSSSSTSSSTSSSSTSLTALAPCTSALLAAPEAPRGSGPSSSRRRRHCSQPQPLTGSSPFSLEDDGIRTTDV
ncbi:pleckstrin homology domain-containing family A member 2 [Aplochiton taeniatus]